MNTIYRGSAMSLALSLLGCSLGEPQTSNSLDELMRRTPAVCTTQPTAAQAIADLDLHIRNEPDRLVSEIAAKMLAEELDQKSGMQRKAASLTSLNGATFQRILALIRVEQAFQEVHLLNLANINTTAYKRLEPTSPSSDVKKIERELADNAIPVESISLQDMAATAPAKNITFNTRHNFAPGAMQQTGSPLDLAIEGSGFFSLQSPIGETVYSRSGMFSLNGSGNLVLKIKETQWIVDPPITVPVDATSIVIALDGVVQVRLAGEKLSTTIGVLQLAMFAAPEYLILFNEGVYVPSDDSGSAKVSNPGTSGAGTIRQGFLEASNVEPPFELAKIHKSLQTTRALKALLGLNERCE